MRKKILNALSISCILLFLANCKKSEDVIPSVGSGSIKIFGKTTMLNTTRSDNNGISDIYGSNILGEYSLRAQVSTSAISGEYDLAINPPLSLTVYSRIKMDSLVTSYDTLQAISGKATLSKLDNGVTVMFNNVTFYSAKTKASSVGGGMLKN
jgi:hypothetical protein